MTTAMLRVLLCGLLLYVVSCSNSPVGPPNPTPDPDLEAARASEVAAVLHLTTSQLSLTWRDRFLDEESFEIDRLNAGAWLRVATLPAVHGIDSLASWDTTLVHSGEYRVVVNTDSASLPLQSTSGAERFAVTIPATAPTLVINAAEPLSGPVTLSILDASGITSVSYYVDLELIATVTAGDGFPCPSTSIPSCDGRGWPGAAPIVRVGMNVTSCSTWRPTRW